MKCRRSDAVKNVEQRISDETAKKVVAVAVSNYPDSVYDFDKLVRTHSCNVRSREDLLERTVAIAASYIPGADRKQLRKMAFGAFPINWSSKNEKKRLCCATASEVRLEETDWFVSWKDEYGITTGLLVGIADDGYEPQVGDEIFIYTVRYSIPLCKVVNGHVFSYQIAE